MKVILKAVFSNKAFTFVNNYLDNLIFIYDCSHCCGGLVSQCLENLVFHFQNRGTNNGQYQYLLFHGMRH
jgi:hypothetical protein